MRTGFSLHRMVGTRNLKLRARSRAQGDKGYENLC